MSGGGDERGVGAERGVRARASQGVAARGAGGMRLPRRGNLGIARGCQARSSRFSIAAMRAARGLIEVYCRWGTDTPKDGRW